MQATDIKFLWEIIGIGMTRTDWILEHGNWWKTPQNRAVISSNRNFTGSMV